MMKARHIVYRTANCESARLGNLRQPESRWITSGGMTLNGGAVAGFNRSVADI